MLISQVKREILANGLCCEATKAVILLKIAVDQRILTSGHASRYMSSMIGEVRLYGANFINPKNALVAKNHDCGYYI